MPVNTRLRWLFLIAQPVPWFLFPCWSLFLEFAHAPRLCFTPLEFAVSCLSSLACWLIFVSVKVPGLYLVLQKSLAWGWSCKGLWLQTTPSELPDLNMPRPTEDLPQAYSFRDPRLMVGPTEFSGSCLFPLTSQTNAQTHRGPGSGLLL